MTTQQPLVSIIMNCYNGQQYLSQAIDSVLSQSYQSWELIFWDNHSTDASAETFLRLKDPRCKYFRSQRHTTLGEARVLALEKASGDWLGFLDCDDVWLKNKLQQQIELIGDDPDNVGLIYGRTLSFFGDHQPTGKQVEEMAAHTKFKQLPEGHIFEQLLCENFIPLVSGLIRRDVYEKVGGIKPHYKQAEDFAMFLAASEICIAKAVQEICCLYRLHLSNISNAQSKLVFIESIEIVSEYSCAAAKAAEQEYGIGLLAHYLRNLNFKSFLIERSKYGSAAKYFRFFWGRALKRVAFTGIYHPRLRR